MFYLAPPADRASSVKAMLLQASSWEEASHWVTAVTEGVANADAMARTLGGQSSTLAARPRRASNVVAHVPGSFPPFHLDGPRGPDGRACSRSEKAEPLARETALKLASPFLIGPMALLALLGLRYRRHSAL